MDEPLVPIALPPGIYRNGTRLQAAGRWYDGNLVRFFDGTIRPIGGWRRAQDATGNDLAPLVGVPRCATSWSSSTGAPQAAFGTTEKLYLLSGGAVHDITPVGFVPGRADSDYTSVQGRYGAGPYGVGPYGIGPLQSTLAEADTWQLDVFGDWLTGVSSSDSKLYVWEGNPTEPAIVPAGAPGTVRGVVVTPERFLVALGPDGDFRKIRWPSQETVTDWVATPQNSAGELPVATKGRVMCGRRTRSQTLIWTDIDVHTLTYIGGSFLYRIDSAGTGCGIVSPNAVAVVDTQAIWMSQGSFFVFDGYTKPIACDVADYVFSDFNETQKSKVFALSLAKYGEVVWYYPSKSSMEIDRYVVYNYRENHWTTGKLSRTAGFDAEATKFPILCKADGTLYEHEVNYDREGLVPYLESGPWTIDGEKIAKIYAIVPDEKTVGDVLAKFYTSMQPTSAETLRGPFTLTEKTDVRFAARYARIRLEEARATDWRVGRMQVGVRAGGTR